MQRLLLEAERLGLAPYADRLLDLVSEREAWLSGADANCRKLIQAFDALPEVEKVNISLSGRRIGVEGNVPLFEEDGKAVREALKAFIPWRKGPFHFFGTDVDTEWESWMKWERVAPHIRPLTGKRVLDIGASSGYYMFKMVEENPAFVLGVEPFASYYYQFRMMQKYAKLENLFMIPCGFEAVEFLGGLFDTVFCMGILYHRKDPFTFLSEVRASMKKGGELVMETMVIEGEAPVALTPAGRYSKMRNITFLPTVSCLTRWLTRSGFTNVRCLDVNRTTTDEQHQTKWAPFESLADFLDPEDPVKTVEGEPAPVRALILADAC